MKTYNQTCDQSRGQGGSGETAARGSVGETNRQVQKGGLGSTQESLTKLPSKFGESLKVLSKGMTGSDLPSRKIALNAGEGCICTKNYPRREITKTRENGVEGMTLEI